MTWEYEDLVLKAVSHGEKLGASYVEARFHMVSGSGISARNGEIIGAEKSFLRGIAVRVIVDGSLGFASTSTLTLGDVQAAVEKAYRRAKAHSRLQRRPIALSEERLGRATYEVPAKTRPEDVDFQEKCGYHQELWRNVSSATTQAKVATMTSFYSEGVEEKVVMSSDGAYVKSRIPRLSLGYNVVVSLPSRGVVQRFFSHAASGGYELIDKWNVHGYLPEDVKTFEKILVEAVKPPVDTPVDVVVGSEIVGLMVHESCGHPSEADRILGREAAQAGKSFIKPEMLGERIGSECATVIDDPTIPGSNGFYLYDDEGVPARPRYLYKNGVINEFLHNRWTAALFNTRSNAAARAMSHEGEPIIRMANTYFAPGDYTFDELVEDIKLGVYIKSYMEWNIDDERWSQRYGGLEAYLIEGGELKGLVRNPVLELTTKTFYSSVDAADKNLEFYAGTCGKGEPMQGVPVWFGGPNVRVRGIKLRVIG
jgi:TldD protein